jgi:transcription elongation factor GreA
MSEKCPITLDGFERIKAEVHDLKTTQRNAISKEIATAREHGDLKENAEYHAAREKQSFLEGRVIDLEDKIARAEVIDTNKLSGGKVKFGAYVKLVDDDDKEVTYRIVGDYEADIAKNLISFASPLARALMGKEVGDDVEVTTPRGSKGYEIVEVRFV